MKIGIRQEEFVFGDIEQNFDIAKRAIEEAANAGARTVILPEMWSTYFSKENLAEKADQEGAKAGEFLSPLAKELNINIIGGSIAEVSDGTFYNSSLVFDQNGRKVSHYRKAHLYKLAGEDNYFSPGDSIQTFFLGGIKCGVCICHDISFPEWIRLYALVGVEVLFVPTGWPETGIENWLHLARARAIENQIFIVCTNSCGIGSFKFGGKSIVVGPDGNTLLELGDSPHLGLVEIDPKAVAIQREKMNLLQERRPDLYS